MKAARLIPEGILMMVEQVGRKRCIFVDKLAGRQQVVVKRCYYLKKTRRCPLDSG
jgi:chemotaxis protein histidine kinase CheA